MELLSNLDGPAFEIYFEKLTHDRSIKKESSDFKLVKEASVGKFENKGNPKEVIRRAMGAKMEIGDLYRSLDGVDTLYCKEYFNEDAKFGLL